jgi:hypothetical protein
MKRAVLILCIIIGRSSWAWADDLAMAASIPGAVHMITGAEVKAISWADPTKGTKSEIVVIGAAKKSTHVLVTSTTTLWDADAKAIMLDKIVPKERVNIIYFTTPEGVNIGKSIKILK